MVAFGVVSALAQGTQRGLGIRLLEAPSTRANDPRAQSYIIDHLNPPAVIERDFEVSNGTDRPLLVELYAGPARIQSGGFVPADRGAESDLTDWIEITPAQVQLSPGEKARGTTKISVPDTAETGEYYGAVWAEIPGEAPTGSGVAVASRVGIRVYLSIGPGGEPPSDFELPSFRPVRERDGRPGIDITACNTGGRALDLVGELSLAEGPGGVSAGPFQTEGSKTVLPETCVDVPIRLDPALPDGPWDATAKLSSGEEERTAEARITFPKEPGGRGKKVETREVTGTLPGIIATGFSVFLLLLLAGGLTWLLLKRRTRKRADEEDPPRV